MDLMILIKIWYWYFTSHWANCEEMNSSRERRTSSPPKVVTSAKSWDIKVDLNPSNFFALVISRKWKEWCQHFPHSVPRGSRYRLTQGKENLTHLNMQMEWSWLTFFTPSCNLASVIFLKPPQLFSSEPSQQSFAPSQTWERGKASLGTRNIRKIRFIIYL